VLNPVLSLWQRDYSGDLTLLYNRLIKFMKHLENVYRDFMKRPENLEVSCYVKKKKKSLQC